MTTGAVAAGHDDAVPGRRARSGLRFRTPARFLAACLTGGAGLLLAGCGGSAASGAPTGSVAYVANVAGLADPGDTLALVDTTSSKSLGTITTGSLPAAVAATPDGAHLLVANKGINRPSDISVSTGTSTGQATMGLEPDAVAVTPDGSLALVANFGDNTVTPVALPSMKAGSAICPTLVGVRPGGQGAERSDVFVETPGQLGGAAESPLRTVQRMPYRVVEHVHSSIPTHSGWAALPP